MISNNALKSLISHLIIMGITKKTDKDIERQTTQDTDELQFILSIALHFSAFHYLDKKICKPTYGHFIANFGFASLSVFTSQTDV